ncbi:hypothetical protein JOE34_001893 [Pseudomonas sp. PvP028]|nr:hypothetical protein [Pseudomonas sp. PvP028]
MSIFPDVALGPGRAQALTGDENLPAHPAQV